MEDIVYLIEIGRIWTKKGWRRSHHYLLLDADAASLMRIAIPELSRPALLAPAALFPTSETAAFLLRLVFLPARFVYE